MNSNSNSIFLSISYYTIFIPLSVTHHRPPRHADDDAARSAHRKSTTPPMTNSHDDATSPPSCRPRKPVHADPATSSNPVHTTLTAQPQPQRPPPKHAIAATKPQKPHTQSPDGRNSTTTCIDAGESHQIRSKTTKSIKDAPLKLPHSCIKPYRQAYPCPNATKLS